MPEYRMTEQTVTTIALHGLINDMHYVLGRIVQACSMVVGIAVLVAGIDALSDRPVSTGLDLMGAGVFLMTATETRRRMRKYRPALVAAKGCDGDEEERA